MKKSMLVISFLFLLGLGIIVWGITALTDSDNDFEISNAGEKIVVGSDGSCYAVNRDSVADLVYSNSSDGSSCTIWNDTTQIGVDGSYFYEHIIIDSRDHITIYARDATSNVIFYNTSDKFQTINGPYTAMDIAGALVYPSCVVDNRTPDPVIHCTATDTTNAYYVNSTQWDTEVVINDNSYDDSDNCDIEHNGICPFVVCTGSDHDNVDIWSPCLNGWGADNGIEIHDGSTDTHPAMAIDDDGAIYVTWRVSADDVWFANSTDGTAGTWGGAKALATSGNNKESDVAVTKDDHEIHILYSDGTNIYYLNSTDGTTWNTSTTLHAGVAVSISATRFPTSNRLTNNLKYVYVNTTPTPDVVNLNKFSITYAVPPSFDNNQTNASASLQTDEDVQMNLSITDDGTLAGYIFSWNGTLAGWVNDNYATLEQNWSYQETPDATGCEGTWDATQTCALTYDGDWDTYGYPDNYVYSRVYLNYTKPTGATNKTRFIWKGWGLTINTTIAAGGICGQNVWNQSDTILQLSLQIDGYDINTTGWDGTGWCSFFAPQEQYYLYDEAVQWHISPSPDISITKTVTVASPYTIGWYVFANDTEGNSNTSLIYTYELGGDVTPPYFYDDSNWTNNTQPEGGESIRLNLTWHDDTGLDVCVLQTNNSGAWANETPIVLSDNPTGYNVSDEITISLTYPNTLGWNYWCNDTSGNENKSQNYTLEIENTAPTHTTPILNSTLGTNLTSENLTVYNQSTNDIDGDSVKNIIDWKKDGTSIAVLNMPFEGGSNSTYTKDYSSYGNDGTVDGATYNSTAGYDQKGAYEFHTTNLIDLGVNAFNHAGEAFSISFWFYALRDDYGLGEIAYIFYFGNDSSGYMYLSLKDGLLHFYDYHPNEFSGCSNCVYYNTGINKWYHVAITLDSSDVKLYINGSLAMENTPDAIWSLNEFANYGSGYNLNYHLGARSTDSANMTLDEIMIFNRTLSAQQINALYNNRTDRIVSQETTGGDTWQACITPNDKTEDGTQKCSNNLTITAPPPAVEIKHWHQITHHSSIGGKQLISGGTIR